MFLTIMRRQLHSESHCRGRPAVSTPPKSNETLATICNHRRRSQTPLKSLITNALVALRQQRKARKINLGFRWPEHRERRRLSRDGFGGLVQMNGLGPRGPAYSLERQKRQNPASRSLGASCCGSNRA